MKLNEDNIKNYPSFNSFLAKGSNKENKELEWLKRANKFYSFSKGDRNG